MAAFGFLSGCCWARGLGLAARWPWPVPPARRDTQQGETPPSRPGDGPSKLDLLLRFPDRPMTGASLKITSGVVMASLWWNEQPQPSWAGSVRGRHGVPCMSCDQHQKVCVAAAPDFAKPSAHAAQFRSSLPVAAVQARVLEDAPVDGVPPGAERDIRGEQ